MSKNTDVKNKKISIKPPIQHREKVQLESKSKDKVAGRSAPESSIDSHPNFCEELGVEIDTSVDIYGEIAKFEKQEASGSKFVPGQSALTSYLKEIGDYKVLSREKELEMFRALRNGDESMVDEIFKANAKLVPFVVKKLSGVIAGNASMGFEDIISAGNIGLLKAIQLFDPDRGYKFSTYAYHWIFSFAERAVCNDANLIRIPVHLQERVNRIRKMEKEMESSINRELTYEEKLKIIEENSGNSRDYISVEQYSLYVSPLSFNALVNEKDEKSEFGNFVASEELTPEQIAFKEELRKDILEAMEECLPERNLQVLKLRFGFETGECMTLNEVGKMFGVTRERIRQIESNSIRLLRRSRKFRHLKEYLEST